MGGGAGAGGAASRAALWRAVRLPLLVYAVAIVVCYLTIAVDWDRVSSMTDDRVDLSGRSLLWMSLVALVLEGASALWVADMATRAVVEKIVPVGRSWRSRMAEAAVAFAIGALMCVPAAGIGILVTWNEDLPFSPIALLTAIALLPLVLAGAVWALLAPVLLLATQRPARA